MSVPQAGASEKLLYLISRHSFARHGGEWGSHTPKILDTESVWQSRGQQPGLDTGSQLLGDLG